jgi:cysteine-rich repeat protein
MTDARFSINILDLLKRMNRNHYLARPISYVCLCACLTIGSIESAESSERSRFRPDRSAGVSAPAKQETDSSKSAGLVHFSRLQALAGPNVLEPNPPELCVGHGDLSSISLTDWENGLDGWTVGTHGIANPDTFDTPDWAVVGSLPDSRPGKAAFVANIESGNGTDDDESGALTLDSPSILIPAGTLVPRISVDHWVATEFRWDGGNIKISVNGGEFKLVPKSAIDFNPYNCTLIAAPDGNTNPLAGENAFTGADNGQQTGSWGQSQIGLFGIAAAGNTIRLRFDFGVDGYDGLIGWYVDDVEVYSCSAEPPPSDCGNGVLDSGEQCDDGNTFIDDGCSNTCQVDDGWQCTDPTPPGNVADGSFEAGTPNPSWTEASTNFGSPICNEIELGCGTGAGTGPADGLFWAWFGGIEEYEESSLSQSVVMPSTPNELRFELEISFCDSPADYLEVLVDGNREFHVDGSSSQCECLGYTTQSVDISAYADGASHNIEFHSEIYANNQDVSNFFVDAVSMPGIASICTPDSELIIFSDGFESN